MKAPSEIVSPHILAALSAAGYRVVAVDGGRDDAREGESPRLVHQPDCWVWGGADEYHEGVPFGGWTRTGDGYHGNQLRDEDRPLYRLAPAALEPDAELEAAPAGTSAALGAERERADLAERVVGWLIGTDDDTHEPGDDSLIEFNGEGWNLWDDDAQEWVALPAESPAAVLLARLSRRWVDSDAADLLARLTGDQP